ncbi:hypothetical protein [Anatilimnocola floriformis]|uniref:hypothetical protein n=1 Tax=Anatilimnocola floriformis TaxID=2948575 RepID=UPI0020C21344|nr:hypothetical protein [Anatilimnocola floriformis]
MRLAWGMAGFVFLAVSVPLVAEESIPQKPSAEQIKAWRKEGPAAVDRLMQEREKLAATNQDRTAIDDTIDAVAAARYAHESGLYWYTDEAEANRVAKEQGKPILALRLLGKLDEELSCANSRYFRILLYPDDKVRQLLHDRFVLTWTSVRPVPKITIDLGDGRKVERTITGNSVHYVVLPTGEVVDVFPGLYGPIPFVTRLLKAEASAQRSMRSKDAKAEITKYQLQQIEDLQTAWKADLVKYQEVLREISKADAPPESIGYVPPPPPSFWEAVASFHPEYSELSKASRTLVKREAIVAERYGRERTRPTGNSQPTADLDYAFSKGGDERAMHTLLACIQPALQADTIYNEYCGRYAALRHMNPIRDPNASVFDDDYKQFAVGGPQPTQLMLLNDFVYSQIFNYDPKDPWIGLARLDSLTALPKDRGLKQARSKE